MTSEGSVLVTGANGFVGSALVRELHRRGHSVVAATRHPAHELASLPGVRGELVGDLGPTTDWIRAVQGCTVTIHCAGRAHIMRDPEQDPSAAFRRVNVQGSVRLARQAAAAGVRRLVFVSSVKVHGEASLPGRPFTESDALAPADPYGVSKAETEAALAAVSSETGLELVIVRPPLVYGPGVKANFLRLTQWLARGVPLPFGGLTTNRRSLVALDNLVDLLICCAEHKAASGQVFLAGDGEDLSTTELLRRTAQALGLRARLVPVPRAVIRGGAALLGARGRSLMQRLDGDLQVDIAHAREVLGWHPPIGVDEGLRRVVGTAV